MSYWPKVSVLEFINRRHSSHVFKYISRFLVTKKNLKAQNDALKQQKLEHTSYFCFPDIACVVLAPVYPRHTMAGGEWQRVLSGRRRIGKQIDFALQYFCCNARCLAHLHQHSHTWEWTGVVWSSYHQSGDLSLSHFEKLNVGSKTWSMCSFLLKMGFPHFLPFLRLGTRPCPRGAHSWQHAAFNKQKQKNPELHLSFASFITILKQLPHCTSGESKKKSTDKTSGKATKYV